jgi:hypothetical protein
MYNLRGWVDGNLEIYAIRLAVIEEYEDLERTSPDAARRNVLEKAKREAAIFYSACFVDGKTSTAKDIALSESSPNLFNTDDLPDPDKVASRIIGGIFGALSILVPMLIMILHPTKLTALVTTIVFTMAVALILALTMTTAEDKDVIGATTAYAAVLIVFIGTASPTGGPKDSIVAAIVVSILVGLIVLYMTLGIKGGKRLLRKWGEERKKKFDERKQSAENQDISVSLFSKKSGMQKDMKING